MALRSLDGRSVIIWQCVVLLVAITTLYTIGLSILAIRGLGNPEIAPILWSTEVRLILALWVRADREVRRFAVPFEFDAFVFFAWPLVLPYYLYRTRGGRGLRYLFGLYGLYLMPSVISAIFGTIHRL